MSSSLKSAAKKKVRRENESDNFVGFCITGYKNVRVDSAGLARRVYVAIKLFTLTCLILALKMRRHQHGYYRARRKTNR